MVGEIIEVARAVQFEMSYLTHVSKSDVLSESSFKYPAVEWLERKGGKEKVFFETAHPIFSRKRTDISWEDGSYSNFIEMKYVKKETAAPSEQQRYFNDLLRLAYIVMTIPQSKAYFLACGQAENWKPCFQNLGIAPPTGKVPVVPRVDGEGNTKMSVNGIYSKWFSFEGSDPTKIINTNEYLEFYSHFVKNYNFREGVTVHFDHIVIKTTLQWISEIDSLLSPCATAVWKISVDK